MDYTENYNLKKPDEEDYFNVGDFNENSDIIDEYLAKGVQAYSWASSLLNQVSGLSSNLSATMTKAAIKLRVYGVSGVAVTLTPPSGNAQSFTIPGAGYTDRNLLSVGDCTLTFSYNGKSYTQTVAVDHPGITRVALAIQLSDAPWAHIRQTSEAGLAEECWSVGDTKSVAVGGTTATVRILGFNHDMLAEPGPGNGKRAGITFALTDTLATKVQMHNSTKVSGNYVDWCDRDLLTTHLPAKLSSMDSALQAAIKTVSKAYLIPENVGSSNTHITTGKGGELLDSKLFLLSEREIFGEARLSNPYYSYDRQYEYYRRANNFKCTVDYWLRNQTWNANDSEYVNILQTDGKIVSSLLTAEQGLMFGFCV